MRFSVSELGFFLMMLFYKKITEFVFEPCNFYLHKTVDKSPNCWIIATNHPTCHGFLPRGRGCCHPPACCQHWHLPSRPMWWSLLLLFQAKPILLRDYYIPFCRQLYIDLHLELLLFCLANRFVRFDNAVCSQPKRYNLRLYCAWRDAAGIV